MRFHLKRGVFIDEERLNKEQIFVYERKEKNRDKIKPITVGYYENDTYEKGHVVLQIKQVGNVKLPVSGTICIDYRKDLVNVERQLDALNILEKEDYCCNFSLKKIISGVEIPTVNIISKESHFFNKKLDFPQTMAVKKAMDAESIAIIQGPPGTGKTNVIIEIILQILKENSRNPDMEPKKILLVSQSHPAVDKMLEDLIREYKDKLDLLRIGRDEKLNEEIREKYSIGDVKERWINDVKTRCDTYAKGAMKEAGIDEMEFENYYHKLEESYIENNTLGKEDYDLIAAFQNKTNGVKSGRIRKILEIQKEWKEQVAKCDEVELYIIKSAIIIFFDNPRLSIALSNTTRK